RRAAPAGGFPRAGSLGHERAPRPGPSRPRGCPPCGRMADEAGWDRADHSWVRILFTVGLLLGDRARERLKGSDDRFSWPPFGRARSTSTPVLPRSGWFHTLFAFWAGLFAAGGPGGRLRIARGCPARGSYVALVPVLALMGRQG